MRTSRKVVSEDWAYVRSRSGTREMLVFDFEGNKIRVCHSDQVVKTGSDGKSIWVMLSGPCTLPFELFKEESRQLRALRTGRRIDRYVGRLQQHSAQDGGSIGGETVKDIIRPSNYGNINDKLAYVSERYYR